MDLCKLLNATSTIEADSAIRDAGVVKKDVLGSTSTGFGNAHSLVHSDHPGSADCFDRSDLRDRDHLSLVWIKLYMHVSSFKHHIVVRT